MKFYSLSFVSLALSRLFYIRILDFSLWGYLNIPTTQQQQNLKRSGDSHQTGMQNHLGSQPKNVLCWKGLEESEVRQS